MNLLMSQAARNAGATIRRYYPSETPVQLLARLRPSTLASANCSYQTDLGRGDRASGGS